MIEASEARKSASRSNNFNDQVVDEAEEQGIKHQPDLAETRIQIFGLIAKAS